MRTRSSEWVIPLAPLGIFPQGRCQLSRTISVPDGLAVELARVPTRATAEVAMSLEGLQDGVLLRGQVDVPVAFECSRCLDPGEYELEVPLNEMFFFEASSDPQDRRVERDTIDLEPVLRDSIVAQLPFQPLCREDCRGLCSQCGIQMAEDPDHQHEIPDVRWEALRALKLSSTDPGGSDRDE